MIAAANLHAFNYGLNGHTDIALFKKVLEVTPIPEWTPKANFKVQITETDAPQEGQIGDSCRSYLRH